MSFSSLYDKSVMSLEWWQKSVVYHVYLPSFKDSNDDGIGDINGLISKLNYFMEMNISTLMLSPFYPSPMKDNGYDISSFIDIDNIYGTMEDFENLTSEMKARGMQLLVDFVANHTSDQHPWFLKSVKKEKPFDDFYIWVDANPDSDIENPLPPNNWLSVFNYSAWTWNKTRKQFYFHQFLPEQPDLNYRNPKVREEMKKILVFWLEKGIDGFRVDAVSHLFEDVKLRNEPISKKHSVGKNDYRYLDHIYTKGLKESLDLLKEWRTVLNEYAEKTGKSKILFVESTEDIEDIMDYYGSSGSKLADFPFNFGLYKITAATTGIELKEKIDLWLQNMPKGKLPNWVLSSHDDARVASRVGKDLGLSLYMVIMLLPGLPFIYYGDEFGMQNQTINPEDMRDSFALRTCPSNSRDPMRTPMQWNGSKHAGFTNAAKPWLPVGEDYETVNVEVLKENPSSFLNSFKQLISFRYEPSILVGTLDFPFVSPQIFSCLRFLAEANCYLLVLNLSFDPIAVDLSKCDCNLLPEMATVEVLNNECSLSKCCHSAEVVTDIEKKCPKKNSEIAVVSHTSVMKHKIQKGSIISLKEIFLKPKEAIILSFTGKL